MSNMSIKQQVAVVVSILLMIFAGGLFIQYTEANATSYEDGCFETVHHDAVTHTVEHEAVTHEETIVDSPAVWANWSPNHTQGPQDYVPIWPEDERGTWHVHDQGIPPGHEGPDGVYQQGQGNSPWFYRQHEVSHTVTIVDQEAWTETVTDIAAYDEQVPVDCPTETEPPATEEPTVTPEPEPKGSSSKVARCIGNNWTVTITDSHGNKASSSAPSARCSKDAAKPAPNAPTVVVEEEGM